ncbi:2-oxo acid dehydrogenase subunit E2 [Bradyrhizobium sp. CCBAU 53421]|uniref:2-oxo acid dehydrogenase subunit E2 n=1 Tax=Bradyrhizobium sp. CCBAU 53421 TaxID=1325120 RepID=UPI00188B257D|nr:2-oxo acid dehydrogenase subunit E2 [Bradyrhizobium sp. CCBAU 53421]QOZ38377.1 branched-chain alpha-keto acid dehydrogenase subunit E2 [Bradyrhizobium sp. CCBAU 53421]
MTRLVDVVLPDIGDYKDVPVIEINVKVGDHVSIDTPLLSIESDKATMEVPSPFAGVIRELKVVVGSRVSHGSPLMLLDQLLDQAMPSANSPAEAASTETASAAAAPALASKPADEIRTEPTTQNADPTAAAHATPSVRAFARELGVDLAKVTPSGAKGRILREDVAAYVKRGLGSAAAPQLTASGGGLADWPKVDFEKFGPVERAALSRIQKIAGANLSRNWHVVPHVTNFDKADVTDAEAFRQSVNGTAGQGAKLTMVSILIKASALALKAFPRFNSSLDGEELVLKKYVHVGFAVDTPNGLMVPVIRDCDRKGLFDIAAEMRALADKAVSGALPIGDMQGGCFSVSSLGGVGGCGFTPIINAPEVAILGAGRSATEAIWDGKAFKPRLILPISLSWDHRVVDGAAAAKFLGFVATAISDLRRFAL